MITPMRFHHIGIAVNSIEKTSAEYLRFGFHISGKIYDPVQNVNICWVTKESMPTIELLEPVDDNSPVCKILEKQGVTPYHMCYVVDSIETAISELRQEKYVLISKPVEATAIQGCKVCFLFNKNIGLIELVEHPASITK